jgi:hypothetical protein
MGLISVLIFAFVASFLAGMVIIITAKTPEKRKVGIILLIIPIILLIIAGAVCGVMVFGLN